MDNEYNAPEGDALPETADTEIEVTETLEEDSEALETSESKSEDSPEKIKGAARATRDVFEWLDALVMALITLVLMFTFVLRQVGVDGESMMQTLQHKDRVIISNFLYEPKYKDIVVISRNYKNEETMDIDKNTKPIIKRVIATEGQTVDIDFETGEIRVDGVLLEEDYINEVTRNKYDVEFPVTVPEGHIFVMGDNRNHSLDSRNTAIGMVDTKYILGKAYVRIWRDKEKRISNGDVFEKLY